jgi:CheY-like chemotaxis protein
MQGFLRHHKTLLCIDDQQNALAGWCLYLQGEGYCVMGAASAQDGLEIFAIQHVDAVILDYAMPDLNGDAVAATMKKMKPDVPIVMFTGMSQAGKQAHKHVDAFVTKGCPPNVLLKTVDGLLQIHDRAAS